MCAQLPGPWWEEERAVRAVAAEGAVVAQVHCDVAGRLVTVHCAPASGAERLRGAEGSGGQQRANERWGRAGPWGRLLLVVVVVVAVVMVVVIIFFGVRVRVSVSGSGSRGAQQCCRCGQTMSQDSAIQGRREDKRRERDMRLRGPRAAAWTHVERTSDALSNASWHPHALER
jgi:hypothetical protein